MAGSPDRRDVPDVVRDVVALAGGSGSGSGSGRWWWWGARPVVSAPVVSDELAAAVAAAVPGAWVVRMPPADDLRVQDAIDEALRGAGTAAPDTRRYDDLTAALRRPAGAGGGSGGAGRGPGSGAGAAEDLLDRRRIAARRERWKHAVEPVVLLWLGLASLGASLMSAADVREFGQGDLAYNLGAVCLCTGMLLIAARLLAGLWRLARGGIRAVPTEQELAQALLRDLRYDARRFFPTGWFRARDVPGRLPVLLVATPADGRRPVLLDEYLRWHSPRLPRWMWWIVAAARRPSAIVVTDHPMPVTVDQQIRAVWRRRAQGRSWLRARRRALRGLPAAVVTWWNSLPGPAWRRPGAAAGAAAGAVVRLRFARRCRARLAGGFLAFLALAWPRRARPRLRRLTAYALVSVLTATALYIQRSPSQPYCLRPMAGSEQDLSTDSAGDEWIGYRTCLGWSQLAGNVAGGAVSAVADRLAVRQPGPDDTPDLFDENLIYRENKRVRQLAGAQRPLVTVALITSLTSAAPTRAIRSVVAEHEGLAGAYAAQRRINSARSTHLPYVRLAIVNTGDLTVRPGTETAIGRHLETLAKKLRQLAADPTLAAAVITVNSMAQVQDALGASLGAAGVPMISPTMSADGFGEPLARAVGRDDDLATAAPGTSPAGTSSPGSSSPGASLTGAALLSAAAGAVTPRPQPMFFQINSTNDDQVQLIYEYARNRNEPLAFFFPVTDASRTEPAADDLYLTSLYCDVWRRRPSSHVQELSGGSAGPGKARSTCPPAPVAVADPSPAAPQVPVSLVPWSSDRPLSETARVACPPETPDVQPRVASASGPGTVTATEETSGAGRPVVFFGGRYTDFAEFAQALRLACGSRMPQVAVSDSAGRFLADRELARHVPHGVQVLIAYRGRTLTCAGMAGAGDAGAGAGGQQLDFYDDIRAYLGRCAGPGAHPEDRWLAGGWAAFSYDSLLLINDALIRAGVPPTASDARGRILGCLRGPAAGACTSTDYPGVYGTIQLDGNGVGRPPAVLLRVEDLTTAFDSPSQVSVVGTCAPTAAPCDARFPADVR
ncbi:MULTISPECIES: sulfotransferase family protein [Parafrankia]|uniref:sulfotransferase family protein n=1 Tax=Parafrankia TaxID=2994362 RepID=UPI000B816E5E|nr:MULTISPECIES: sulfotransferase family protein [Parafrankia]MBE3202290.1 sulfotransferase family protein [Parafrankia sp. CH37]